jgi:hypothetical protein
MCEGVSGLGFGQNQRVPPHRTDRQLVERAQILPSHGAVWYKVDGIR